MLVKKAVIPIAGKGTRFLPATKQMAKEIIPILNIPMIHYVVMEAVNSGIEQVIFVTSYGKEPVENYFDRNFELEMFLEKNGKTNELKLIQEIGSMVEVTTVRQKEQLGLGHAVLMAKHLIGKGENFAVLLGDDIILSDVPATRQLMNVSNAYNDGQVIAVMEVLPEETSKYGIVGGKHLSDKTIKMDIMVEKPKPESSPSNLATPGRYILNSEVFNVLKKMPKGAGGEYQLTDAINIMCKSSDFYAHIFDGERFDTGNIAGYLNATMEFALRDPELKDYALKIMQEKLKRFS